MVQFNKLINVFHHQGITHPTDSQNLQSKIRGSPLEKWPEQDIQFKNEVLNQ